MASNCREGNVLKDKGIGEMTFPILSVGKDLPMNSQDKSFIGYK
jgi:hypothetical protein